MQTDRPAVAHKIAGCLIVVATIAALLWSAALGFNFEPTDDALYRESVSRTLARSASIAGAIGVVAIVVRRRSLGLAAAVLGVAVLAAAGGRAVTDLDPEAGEARVAAAFAPPAGAVAATADDDPWQGYSFPTLHMAWSVPDDDFDALCRDVRQRVERWSDANVRLDVHADGCFLAGRRDDHDGEVYVRPSPNDPHRAVVDLHVTRRV